MAHHNQKTRVIRTITKWNFVRISNKSPQKRILHQRLKWMNMAKSFASSFNYDNENERFSHSNQQCNRFLEILIGKYLWTNIECSIANSSFLVRFVHT